jgi:type VI secretion system protein ImpH
VRGQWLALDVEEQSRLPGSTRGVGGNNRLGVDAVAGARVWDVQSKFRIRVGPLPYARFRALMPSGDALRPLCQLARSFVGPGLDFDVQPVLIPEEVPWCRLGGGGGGGGVDGDGPFLGWNTWIRGRPFAREVAGPAFSSEGR